MSTTLEKVKNFIFKRGEDYRNTFDDSSESAKNVLKDLESFCRANESTFNPDPRIHAVLEGRREVYLRIRDQLVLSNDELWAKYSTNKGKLNDN